MSNTYLLIAYKPNSSDYCRGCLMASYSSDFIKEDNLDQDELIKTLADIYYKNKHLAGFESGYDYWIYSNAIQVDGISMVNNEGDYVNPTGEDYQKITESAEALCKKRIDDESAIQRKSKEEARLKHAEELKAKREKEYKKLKEEFEKGDLK